MSERRATPRPTLLDDDLELARILLDKRDALLAEADKIDNVVAGVRQAHAEGRTEHEIAGMFAELPGLSGPSQAAAVDEQEAKRPDDRRFAFLAGGGKVEHAWWDLTVSAYPGGVHDSRIDLDEATLEEIGDAVRRGMTRGELVIDRDQWIETGEDPAETDHPDDADRWAWTRRFRRQLGDRQWALAAVTFHVGAVDGDEEGSLVRRVDYTVATDPDDPSSAIWAGHVSQSVATGGTADDHQARRLCASFDPDRIPWDGRPVAAGEPVPAPPLPDH